VINVRRQHHLCLAVFQEVLCCMSNARKAASLHENGGLCASQSCLANVCLKWKTISLLGKKTINQIGNTTSPWTLQAVFQEVVCCMGDAKRRHLHHCTKKMGGAFLECLPVFLKRKQLAYRENQSAHHHHLVAPLQSCVLGSCVLWAWCQMRWHLHYCAKRRVVHFWLTSFLKMKKQSTCRGTKKQSTT